METTKANETIIESAKLAEKWFNDTNNAMMEIYNKQLNLTTGLYNNFFSTLTGNVKGLGDSKNIFDSMLKNDFTKWFSMPSSNYNSIMSNSILSTFDGMYKQITDFNRNITTTLHSQLNNREHDWSSLNKEYMETIEKQMEVYKKIINTISEANNRELSLSLENNKKIIEEINEQFGAIIKQNQKFWSEALKYTPVNQEYEDKKNKETNQSSSKKQTNVLVNS